MSVCDGSNSPLEAMHGLFGSIQSPLSARSLNAGVDTAMAHRACIPVDLRHLGIYVLGHPFRRRNIPTVSDGRNSFPYCRSSTLRMDAFERRPASNTG